MTTDEFLALVALALFLAVSLWLGLTRNNPRGPNGVAMAPPSPAALLGHTVFCRRPLHSAEADHSLAQIERHLARRADGHRALPQVALAALLQPLPSGHPARDAAARAALAARRLDIAILDAQGRLAIAIGLGAPDDITRSALDRAAVPLLVTSPADPDLTDRIDALLGPSQSLLTC